MDLIISLAYMSLEIVLGIIEAGWTNEEYPTDRKEAGRIHAMVASALAFGGIATYVV
jgi:hypothetical protein